MPVPAGPSSVVTVEEVKTRLRKSSSADDAKIQDMIDEAEAEYAEWVLGLPGQSPITGSVTETVDGGQNALYLSARNVSAITSATYTDGTTIDVDDLVLGPSGRVSWGYGTAGVFTRGTRNLTITYTLGSLPPNHKGAIIADVVGYFSVTQRSGVDPRADFPGEGAADSTFVPGTLFPHIRKLVGMSVA